MYVHLRADAIRDGLAETIQLASNANTLNLSSRDAKGLALFRKWYASMEADLNSSPQLPAAK